MGIVVASALVFAACGTGDPAPAEATQPSTTQPSTTLPATTFPSTSTMAPAAIGEEPLEAAVAFLDLQWSTREPWGSGWVDVRSTATGASIADRDSELGRFFSDAV
jgi:hypothetical protein